MIHSFASYLATRCVKSDLLEEKLLPFFIYKAERILSLCLFSIILFTISAITHRYIEVLSFSVSAFVFRRHMGGWHAPRAWICQLLSMLIVLVFVFFCGPVIESINTRNVILALSTTLNGFAFFLKPAFPPQLHLNKKEKDANIKLKNRWLLFLTIVHIGVFFWSDIRFIIYSSLGLASTVITVLLEKIKNIRKGSRHENPEENR